MYLFRMKDRLRVRNCNGKLYRKKNKNKILLLIRRYS